MPMKKQPAELRMQRQEVISDVLKRNRWTYSDLADYLESMTGDSVGYTTVRAWMAREGSSLSARVPGWVIYLLRQKPAAASRRKSRSGNAV